MSIEELNKLDELLKKRMGGVGLSSDERREILESETGQWYKQLIKDLENNG